jgi:hypothetical protein
MVHANNNLSYQFLDACRRSLPQHEARFLYWYDLLPLAGLLPLHAVMLRRYVPVYGWPIVLLSPGVGWAPHAAGALLVAGLFSVQSKARRVG